MLSGLTLRPTETAVNMLEGGSRRWRRAGSVGSSPSTLSHAQTDAHTHSSQRKHHKSESTKHVRFHARATHRTRAEHGKQQLPHVSEVPQWLRPVPLRRWLRSVKVSPGVGQIRVSAAAPPALARLFVLEGGLAGGQ